MEELIKQGAEAIALGLEAISVLIVGLGGLQAAYQSARSLSRDGTNHGLRRAAWLSMARWLLLGLEFMLAADIVRSTIAPNWQDIGQLAAIAVIRTFLNYFLERDLKEIAEVEPHLRTAIGPNA